MAWRKFWHLITLGELPKKICNFGLDTLETWREMIRGACDDIVQSKDQSTPFQLCKENLRRKT
jgi:hypothetical protein